MDRCGLFDRPDDATLHLFDDRDDELVRVTDAEAIRRVWPQARVRLSSGLGHHRTLWDKAVWHDVAAALHNQTPGGQQHALNGTTGSPM